MAALTLQTAAIAGTTVTYANAAGGGDTVANPSRGQALLVVNGDASSTTVTVAVPGNAWNGAAAPDTAVTVAAGATKLIALDQRYADPSTGLGAITYSSVTSLTIAWVTV